MSVEIEADQEKQTAALSSLIAAVGLTGFKIIIGLLTGSLGILAEAAHSGFDLIAAAVTYIAVRVASRPADRTHHYGHGKVENLSAMFETVLLLVTCLWIIWAAIERLVTGKSEIEVNIWSFGVMVTSIVVDVSRSRMLYKVAAKHRSQALEADALHFHTDIWSSAVVILGLACVKLSDWIPSAQWLHSADAAAALVVALIVIGVSIRLGFRTINALLDAAPAGIEEKIIAAAEAVPGVANCHNVRVRYSGPKLFADIHVLMDGNRSLREAHELTEAIERAISGVAPEIDVTVHPEPAETKPG